MNSGKSYFANLLKHQQNVQQKGCAYYQINEANNMSSNASRRFVVGAYLQGRDNASAVFMAKSGDYGEEVPHRAEFDAPVGRALGPTAELNGTSAAPNAGCWVREFSHAVVAVNANKGPAPPSSPLLICSLMLDSKRFSYKDVYGRQVEGSEVAGPFFRSFSAIFNRKMQKLPPFSCILIRNEGNNGQSHLMTQRSFCERIERSGSSTDEVK